MKNTPTEKNNLHPRNPHRFRYDFPQLIQSCPALANYVFVNQYNSETIDFSNPKAVKMLNKAILKHFYGVDYWDIPANYLCPPIPGRADYIHYIADLLAAYNKDIIPEGRSIKVLDIGVGANCVYPIIGTKTYGWQFVGSDIDEIAIESAQKICNENLALSENIECRLQKNPINIFRGIIQPDEVFDVTICNPPFHSSQAEAMAGTQRKLKNLKLDNKPKPILNFGGQNSELWCEGGEIAFIKKIVKESVSMANQCFWFTSLVSKKENLPSIYFALKNAKVFDYQTFEMAQGQKVSRFVAWTFWNDEQHKTWREKRNSKRNL